MHREPSDNELVDWLHGHQQLSIPALRESILAKAEPWCVSVKRLRRFRTQKVPNVAVCAPAVQMNRAGITAGIKVAHIEGISATDGSVRIANFMGGSEPTLLGLLYESDRNIISWYYEVYAQSFASGDINAIASGIFGREVRGPMTLVKNGPTSSAFSFAVDRGAVAKVLWYYYASAVDPTIVAAERAFERMLVG